MANVAQTIKTVVTLDDAKFSKGMGNVKMQIAGAAAAVAGNRRV